MNDPSNKNLILDEFKDVILNDKEITQLFSEWESYDSSVAQFIRDCVAHDLNILEMKRLAIARGLTNKEVLLAYKVDQKVRTCIWNKYFNKDATECAVQQNKNSIKYMEDCLTKPPSFIKDYVGTPDCSPEDTARICYERLLEHHVKSQATEEELQLILKSPKYTVMYAMNIMTDSYRRQHEQQIYEGAIKAPYWWGVYQNWFRSPR